jgi:outer membrane protein assembly factor BamB
VPCALLVRQDSILAASGRTLFCLDATGQEVWQKELVSELTSMPMECPVAGRPLLICGSKDGTVTALGMDGRIAWQSSIHDEVNSYMALLPQQDKAPLIVCSGLWGSVHAFDGQGHRLWYHTFRSKTALRRFRLM